ncbi:hypothetical protein E4U17_003614 [Claviceps sp. LM77 group G4]|nr:hypothetical protein E4U17_003614 [Claviceps sp. LM77 group G4]KAG6076814.1 hypothetical protein E4U33_001640 [Claviceps sp. LM78 group G4]KAG6083863.1 hypothetical protein E4U16_003206 [Claviceps sp. LM84 group G4]
MERPDDAERRASLTPGLEHPREPLHKGVWVEENSPRPLQETPISSAQVAVQSTPAGGFHRFSRPLAQDLNIKPFGNGHHFSYQREPRDPLGLKQLGPASFSCSDSGKDVDDESSRMASLQSRTEADASDDHQSVADGEDGGTDMSCIRDGDEDTLVHDDTEDEEGNDIVDNDDGDYYDDSDASYDSDGSASGAIQEKAYAEPYFSYAAQALSSPSISVPEPDMDATPSPSSRQHAEPSSSTFEIEEMDLMDSGCEGMEILHPTEIETVCSRSCSCRRKGFERDVLRDFKNLTCNNGTWDDESDETCCLSEEARFRQRQKDLRRIRRLSMSSSYGKRTHSEMSGGSESSEAGALDVWVADVGSSAIRMRNKRLRRGSLLFQDPPAPRIDELDEPDSSEETCDVADPSARALPPSPMRSKDEDLT